MGNSYRDQTFNPPGQGKACDLRDFVPALATEVNPFIRRSPADARHRGRRPMHNHMPFSTSAHLYFIAFLRGYNDDAREAWRRGFVAAS